MSGVLKAGLIGAHGLIDAAPLGMVNYRGSAFADDWIGGQHLAIDTVYIPVRTPFLRSARVRGLTIVTGFDLFKALAMRSFAAFTGIDVSDRATLERLDHLNPDRETTR